MQRKSVESCGATAFQIRADPLLSERLNDSSPAFNCIASSCNKSASSRTFVPHRPCTAITAAIFISLPWRSTDVQVRVRCTREHHHSSGVAHYSRKTRSFRVKGPKNHPVRTDGDGGTRRVERICIASLCRAIQHINQTRRGVRRLRLSSKNILKPNHTHRIESHVRASHDTLITGNTNPIVLAGMKDRQVSLMVHFRDRGLSRHGRWTGQHCPSDFLFDYFFGR